MNRFIHRNLKYAAVITCVMLTAGAQAQVETRNDVYANISEIPASLRQMIGNYGAQFKEQYISNTLAIIRRNGRTKDAIDNQDADALQKKETDQGRRQQVFSLLRYDADFDGKVTRDEIKNTLSADQVGGRGMISQEHIDRTLESAMRPDADADGILTMNEMSTLKEGTGRSSMQDRQIRELLSLDGNKDGRLTIEELTQLADKAFGTVDADGDGILSQEEMKLLQEMNRAERSFANGTLAQCSFPAAAEDEKIVFLGAYEGESASTISVSGQVEETNVIQFHVGKGQEKIYLVASSFKPVIWWVTGDASRISRVVLAGPSVPDGTSNNDMGRGKINAGITGVAADKVTFWRTRDCGLRSAYEDSEGQQLHVKAALTRLLGRAPDLFRAQYAMMGAHMREDRLDADMTAVGTVQKTVPEGFDAAAWSTHLRFNPGGLVDLSAEKIVSDAPAVPYQVLPGWAGIAKLVKEGALESMNSSGAGTGARLLSVERGFKIVKDIPNYPAGLYGAHAVYFLVAKGVTPPKGDAGHSCVVSEETGEAIKNARICR